MSANIFINLSFNSTKDLAIYTCLRSWSKFSLSLSLTDLWLYIPDSVLLLGLQSASTSPSLVIRSISLLGSLLLVGVPAAWAIIKKFLQVDRLCWKVFHWEVEKNYWYNVCSASCYSYSFLSPSSSFWFDDTNASCCGQDMYGWFRSLWCHQLLRRAQFVLVCEIGYV